MSVEFSSWLFWYCTENIHKNTILSITIIFYWSYQSLIILNSWIPLLLVCFIISLKLLIILLMSFQYHTNFLSTSRAHLSLCINICGECDFLRLIRVDLRVLSDIGRLFWQRFLLIWFLPLRATKFKNQIYKHNSSFGYLFLYLNSFYILEGKKLK